MTEPTSELIQDKIESNKLLFDASPGEDTLLVENRTLAFDFVVVDDDSSSELEDRNDTRHLFVDRI
jgi:hypothetical protein